MLQVVIEPGAWRELEAVPSPYQERLLEVFDRLAGDPMAGKPLKGELRGLRSYRVGDYRALYRVLPERGWVLVTHVGNRREVYRRR